MTDPYRTEAIERRDLLQAIGTGVVGAAGTALSTGTGAAQSGDVTVVDIRQSGPHELPVVDELLIFAHGWQSSGSGPGQASQLAGTLSGAGYEPDEVVAFVYQADASAPEDALVQSEQAASEFAPIVQAAIDAGVGSIRLAGHSLGGRVVLGTVTNLDDGYVVDTVAPMGTAAVGSTVTEGGRWYDGVANHAGAVRNYFSRNDGVVGDGAFGGQGDTSLGAEGTPDSSTTPDTYTDVDVTSSVSSHGGYMSSSALGQDLAQTIAEQADATPTPTPEPTTPGPVGDNANPPTDPDGDGLYEDVNGNEGQDLADAVDLYQNRNAAAVQDHVDAYDFSGNDEIDLADVVQLYQENTN